ncbi:TonB-dependent siderophore receptor [Horticoccus sp. 23ND18S-11]|uniref:TonB-dependent siderophore receptor n=1 Tax=Horticoccus sp. 23ND18S-11 TaxID=3391832 RepID=UPI0039C8EDE4
MKPPRTLRPHPRGPATAVTLAHVRRCAAFLATTTLVIAQTAPRPAAAPAAGEEPVALKEFNVTAQPLSEYAAAEATTGTRVVSTIRDLPFNVNVVTGELLDDFQALDFRDQMAYTSNVTGYETLSSGYSIRGFDADVQLRNGFRRIGLIDKVNIERAEVIKGPAASLYGAVFPGGIVNFVTRKPQTKRQQRVTFTVGNHDLYRAQLSSTGPLGGSRSLFYRIDAAADQRTFDQHYKEKNQATVSGQLLFRPSQRTSVNVEFEWLERRERGITSNSTVPFRIQPGVLDPYRVQPAIGTPRTYNRYVGIATEIIDFNSQGPHTYANRYVRNVTGTLEHRFTDVFSFRSSANWFERGLVRQEAGGRDQFNPVTRTIQRGTARYRPFPEGGATWQNDLVASFATAGVKHKLLLTLDAQRQTQQPKQYDAAVNQAFPASVAAGLSIDTPDYRFAAYKDNPALFTTVQNEDDTIDIRGVFLSERASLLDGRLLVLAGLRHDSATSTTRDRVSATTTKIDSAAWTHQLGLNFRVVPQLTVYANTSKSFVPQFGSGLDINGARFNLPNENGRGWEAGFKGEVIQNRLTFTLGYFDITLNNVATTVNDPATGRTVTLTNGEQASRGAEFDFNLIATDALQFFGGYGHTKARVESFEGARHLVGSPTRRTPHNTVGVGAKYDFKHGRLKGAYATLGFRYNSPSLPNPSTGRNLTASVTNPIVNNPMPNGLLPFPNLARGALVTVGQVRVDDGRESIRNAAYRLVDAGAGYRWRREKAAHKVQVNLSNVFDRRYTYGSSGQGDRLGLSMTYDLTY